MKKNKRKKTVVICNFPRFSDEIWLPVLWAQAKTYYELYGNRSDEWNWYPCYADLFCSKNKEKIKEILLDAKPDIFAISLYVWNYTLSYEIAQWVKEMWPKCIVISGGPHQYFKHDMSWFKEHWYLDASHPGDGYGELAFKEILDNYDDINKTVNWNNVTDIRFPTKGRNIKISNLSMSRADKKVFQYEWSALARQQAELTKFVEYKNNFFPKSKLLSVLETTRGCPYGCTYCDWGGGINTTVIKKSVEAVKADIDSLKDFKIGFLYIGDANFGIFGDRDIDILNYIVRHKKLHDPYLRVGYGGFAKTANKLETIREIINIDVNNNLHITNELKISLQSLDPQVLKNIDRKNIELDDQLAVYQPLAKNKKLPLFVELIMALPGTNLDKYYHELNVLGKHRLSVTWFEWILLPETPAYAASYRSKYGLKTIFKNKGWNEIEDSSQREIVIGGPEITTDNYLQMLLSNSLYHVFIKGGFFVKTVEWIISTYKIGLGDIIKNIYENGIMSDSKFLDVKEYLVATWEQILKDTNRSCHAEVNGQLVFLELYFAALIFANPNTFANDLINWIGDHYKVPLNLLKDDSQDLINIHNFGTIKRLGLYTIDFRKSILQNDFSVKSFITLFVNHRDSGRIFKGNKKLLGIFKISN